MMAKPEYETQVEPQQGCRWEITEIDPKGGSRLVALYILLGTGNPMLLHACVSYNCGDDYSTPNNRTVF